MSVIENRSPSLMTASSCCWGPRLSRAWRASSRLHWDSWLAMASRPRWGLLVCTTWAMRSARSGQAAVMVSSSSRIQRMTSSEEIPARPIRMVLASMVTVSRVMEGSTPWGWKRFW